MKKAFLYFWVLLYFTSCLSHKKNTSPYAGNSVFEGWYADPEGTIFKDKYWIFPIIDKFYNGAQPIDQFIFQDAGHFYMYYGGWGHCNAA